MEKFKILVTDHLAEEGLKILAADNEVEVEVQAGIKLDELKKIIGNYDAIITRSGTTIKEDLDRKPGPAQDNRPCRCRSRQYRYRSSQQKGPYCPQCPDRKYARCNRVNDGPDTYCCPEDPARKQFPQRRKMGQKEIHGDRALQ